MPEAWQTPPQYQPPYFDPANSGPAEPAPYFTPPTKKRSGFWKITTGIVIAGVAVLVIWTVFSRDGGKSDTPATVLNAADSGTNPSTDDSADPDGDNLTNADEKKYSTNPNDPDTDKDGFNDGHEVANGYNPNGSGRLSVDAPTDSPITTDPNRQTLVNNPELSGEPLSKVYSGKGSFVCKVTGGQTEQNTVTVKVKDGKVRQETPVNGSTLVFVIKGREFYMSGFEGGKYLKLEFDITTGIATGESARVRNGIFASEPLILASDPLKASCEAATLSDSDFEISADQLVNPS